jgi:hypothetical protein
MFVTLKSVLCTVFNIGTDLAYIKSVTNNIKLSYCYHPCNYQYMKGLHTEFSGVLMICCLHGFTSRFQWFSSTKFV